MSDINIFGRPEQTTIADSDKIAAGSGTSAFFNITWLAFKALLNTLGALVNVAYLNGTNVFNNGTFNPIEVSRPSAANIVITYTHQEGSNYLGMGTGRTLHWGPSPVSGDNALVFDSANSNNSTSNWTCLNLNYYGALNNLSDVRTKNTIKSITFDLDKYLKINPICFKYNGKDDVYFGFSAQELKVIYPEYVGVNSDLVIIDGRPVEVKPNVVYDDADFVMFVKPMEMIGLMLKASQEMYKSLDNRLSRLEM